MDLIWSKYRVWQNYDTKYKVTLGVSIGIITIIPICWFGYIRPNLISSNTLKMEREDPNIVILYQYHRFKYCPNPSPFCVKLETFLRINNIKYIHDTKILNLPRGKLPIIRHKGKEICDSQLIIEYLTKEFNIKMDDDLSEIELSESHILRRMIEEAVYWEGVYMRWVEEKNWKIYAPLLFEPYNVPNIMAIPMIYYYRKKHLKQLYEQGTGRYSIDELHKMVIKDMNAIGRRLGDTKYYFGDKIHSIDCVLFGFLSGIYWVPFEAKIDGKELPFTQTINHYLDRVHNAAWNKSKIEMQKTQWYDE